MLFRYAERVVDCKVAYVSSWPHNLAVDTFTHYFLESVDRSWHVHADRLEDSTFRIILEPKKLQVFTPRFHLFTRALIGMPDEAVGQLLAGADVVVVVAREEEAAELLEHARKALAGASDPVPRILQIVGPLSAAGHHALAALVPVMGSPEEVFGAVMQAVADRFGNDVASDADPAILAAAEEFRRWSTLPFKRGPAQAIVAQTQVTPKVLLIMLAVLVAIIAFGIIVGILTTAK